MKISCISSISKNYRTESIRFGERSYSHGIVSQGSYKSLLDEKESSVPVEQLPVHNYECLDIALKLLKMNQKEIDELKKKVDALESRPVYRKEMPCGPRW